jgi:hypothetical protein
MSIRIPAFVEEIGGSSFAGVKSLIDLSLEEGTSPVVASLGVIEEYVFRMCFSIR